MGLPERLLCNPFLFGCQASISRFASFGKSKKPPCAVNTGGFPSFIPLQITRRKHHSRALVLSRADVTILSRFVRSCNTANVPERIHTKNPPDATGIWGFLHWTGVQSSSWPGDQFLWHMQEATCAVDTSGFFSFGPLRSMRRKHDSRQRSP